jgi:hypothetical protein
MDSTALKFWAYNRGKAGLPMFDRGAIDIGSTVHAMAEMDLRGRPDREIEAYIHNCLSAPDHLRKAFASFTAFREWRQQCSVRAIAQETPLVSETYQYGGTPDTIAIIGNGLGILDFKTSAKPYPDHLIALAAHGNLWNERHPGQPLTSYHLIILPKDGSGFQHHAYDDLSPQWELFQIYLQAYAKDKACAAMLSTTRERPATRTRPATIVPSPKAKLEAELKAKPRVRVKAGATPHIATMAELLRSYGHVPEYQA